MRRVTASLGLGIGKDSANDVGADDDDDSDVDGPRRCQHKQHVLRGRPAKERTAWPRIHSADPENGRKMRRANQHGSLHSRALPRPRGVFSQLPLTASLFLLPMLCKKAGQKEEKE